MKTKVTHKGRVREWAGPLEYWNAHSEVIIGWCDGCNVESNIPARDGSDWYAEESSGLTQPTFSSGVNYRLAKREPKPGEVWKLGKITLHITVGKLAVDQSGGLYDLGKYELDQMKYITPDIRTYYAREALQHGISKDSGFDYEDSRKLLEWIKQAAQLEVE